VLTVSAVSGDAASQLGLTNEVVTGSGNVQTSDAITFAEVKAIVEGDVDDVVVTLSSAGQVVITNTSSEAPEDTSLQLLAGNNALIDALGIASLVTAVTGVGSGTVPTLRFEAGWRGLPSPGEHGNAIHLLLAKAPRRASFGVGLDLALDAGVGDEAVFVNSAVGVRSGSMIRLFEGLREEYATVRNVSSAVVGGSARVRIDLANPLVKAFEAATSQLESIEYTLTVSEDGNVVETWPFLSPLEGADNFIVDALNNESTGSTYVRVVELETGVPVGTFAETDLEGGANPHMNLEVSDFVGDEDARTGFEALRSVIDAEAVMLAPSIDPSAGLMPLGEGAQQALAAFAETMTGMTAFISPPLSVDTKAAMRQWRLSVLGVDSPAVTQWPWVRVRDRFGRGVDPTRLVPPTGAAFGAWAAVLAVPTPEGGVARAAAGEPPYGELAGVVGLSASPSDKDHGDLNAVGVQVIRMTRLTSGRTAALLMGARTLSSDSRWVSAPVRRTANFIARTLKLGLQFAVFRNNNDPRRITPLLTTIRGYLRSLWRQGQLRGATEQEAFFVADVTTPEDNLAFTTRIRVGIAYQRPSEFIEVEMTQVGGSASLTEL
jgi:phage tail sheath protein FI